MAKALTSLSVKNLRPRAKVYEVADRGCVGLRVTVQVSGHLSWAVRYRFHGRPRKLVLGPVLFEDRADHSDADKPPMLDTPLNLADARFLATRALREVKSGIDPAAVKQQTLHNRLPDDTVRSVCEEYTRRHAHLRSLAQRRYDLGLIDGQLGAKPIAAVKVTDLVRLLDKIETEHGPASADRVRATWAGVANWHAGRVDDFRPPILRGAQRYKSGPRSKVLSDTEVRAIWAATDALRAPFGHFVRILFFTAARRTEVAGMRRSEFTDPATWIIPGSRYKTARDTLIPLSRMAQTIIANTPTTGDSDLVFTTNGRAPIRDFSRFKIELDRLSGISGWRLHDIRRTARTLLSRAGVDADVAEQCLGHVLHGVRATYDRHTFEQEKRAAFEKLASQIERILHPDSKVIGLRERR